MEHSSATSKKNLIVYKASAGSGKTFTLVSEYLAIVIDDYLRKGTSEARYNPPFGHILAITFTNKATAEMKMRILNTLYDIAHAKASANAYIAAIKTLIGRNITSEDIIRSAKLILRDILHKYDYFDVKTIDSFYQNIIANIAIMIGFHSDLEVYLDDDEAISNAVDNIANGKVATNERRKEYYLELLNKYIDDNIEDEASWDFRKKLKKFGSNICKEIYMMNSEKINSFFDDKTAANEFILTLRQMQNKYVSTASEIVNDFSDYIQKLGVSFDDIKQSSKLIGILCKIKNLENIDDNKTRINLLSSPENWLYAHSNKKYRREIAQTIEQKIFPAFVQLDKNFQTLQFNLNSIKFTLSNINDLRMLSMIDEEVKRNSRESNRILLSKSQELIKEEIKTSTDISFVFEQAGKQYRHLMLDEAQDTSRMQWDNLKNLLLNIISNIDGRCVVVGDAKQSIYRWRNSDWSILDNLGKDNGDTNFKERTQINTLGKNFRSEANIVQFNSTFFQSAKGVMNESAGKYCANAKFDINDLYRDVAQQVVDKQNDGFVQFDILPQQDKSYPNNAITTTRLRILLDNIDKLHKQGLPYSQMAILVNANKDIKKITDYIEENQIDLKINTGDSYNLTNAKSVSLIIAAIKYLYGLFTGNEDNVSKTFLSHWYINMMNRDNFSTQSFYEDLVLQHKKEKHINTSDTKADTSTVLPECLVNDCEYLMNLPIKALCIELLEILHIHELREESAYIYTFLDYIDEYTQNNAYDIDRFLDDWEVECTRIKISTVAADGIQAMTIHKAKGLEFHTVFIPFCDWKLLPKPGSVMLWCKTDEKPYCKLPLVPMQYDKNAAKSIYAPDYFEENEKIIIDNLNELYVAFTRPKTNLFVELSEDKATDAFLQETIAGVITESLSNEKFKLGTTISSQDYIIPYDENNDINIKQVTFGNATKFSFTETNINTEHFSLQGDYIETPFR